MRKSYEKLIRTLDSADAAKACIAQNRGPEKEEAREGYEHAIGEELAPAFKEAFDDAIGDLEAKDLHAIGRELLRRLEKSGHTA